jgi:hypothetical protein
MNTSELNGLTDSEISRRADEARKLIAKAQATAAELKRAKDEATAESERNPTDETAIREIVAGKKAKKAEKDAEDLSSAARPLFAEASVRAGRARLPILREQTDTRALNRATVDRLSNVVNDFRSEVRVVLGAFMRALSERNSLVDEHTGLEAAYGTGDVIRRIEPHSALAALAEPIEQLHFDRTVGQPTVRLLGGSEKQVTFTITIPLS